MITLNKKSWFGRLIAFSCKYHCGEHLKGNKPMPTNICTITRELIYAVLKGIIALGFFAIIGTLVIMVGVIPFLYPFYQFFPTVVDVLANASFVNGDIPALVSISFMYWSAILIVYTIILYHENDCSDKIRKIIRRDSSKNEESDTSKFVKAYKESKLNKICINVEWKDDE